MRYPLTCLRVKFRQTLRICSCLWSIILIVLLCWVFVFTVYAQKLNISSSLCKLSHLGRIYTDVQHLSWMWLFEENKWKVMRKISWVISLKMTSCDNTIYYIHTEIYPLKRCEINFRSQAGLSSWKPIKGRVSFFHVWRKRYVQSGAAYHVFWRMSHNQVILIQAVAFAFVSLFNSLASVEVNFPLSLKTWMRKDLLPTILRFRIVWKVLRAKTQKRRRSEMWKCWKSFCETNRKERRARSAY